MPCAIVLVIQFLYLNALFEVTAAQRLDISPYPRVEVLQNGALEITCNFISGSCIGTFEWKLNGSSFLSVVWINGVCYDGTAGTSATFSCNQAPNSCHYTLAIEPVHNNQHGNKWYCGTGNYISPTTEVFVIDGMNCDINEKCDTYAVFDCYRNGDKCVYTLILSNVQNNQHGETWSFEGAGNATQETSIYVNVPITGTDITFPVTSGVTVIENVKYSFVCETTAGRPISTIQWYKKSKTGHTIALNGGIINTKTNGTLIVTKSTLAFVATKADQNHELYCVASNNGSQYTVTSSRRPYLDIQYPPYNPELRYGSSSGQIISKIFQVIRGDNFSIHCKFTSKPESSYRWTGQMVNDNILTIRHVQTDNSWTCTATNSMMPTERESVPGIGNTTTSVNVLYGPSVPVMMFYYNSTSIHIESAIKVIHGSSFNMSCEGSDSNPVPSYSWSGAVSSTTAMLHISNATIKMDSSIFKCHARNVMARTYGDVQYGAINTEFTLDILYAPTIHTFENETVAENSSFTKLCEVHPGNPPVSQFLWTINDGQSIAQQKLVIPTVSMASSGKYTCTVRNVMEQTGGNTLIGEHSRSFWLVVAYGPSIELFTIDGSSINSLREYDESSILTINCLVHNHPEDQILLRRDDTVIAESSNTLELRHIVPNVTCLDAGVYSCTARNRYTMKYQTNELQVLIRCPPRIYDKINNETFTRNLDDEVTLSVTVLAYPVPDTFVWFKRVNSSHWSRITEGISTHQLQSNLTLLNMQDKDFGQYKVKITNQLGVLERLFYVAAGEHMKVERGPKSDSTIGILAGITIGVVAVIILVTVVVILRRQNRLPGFCTKKSQTSSSAASKPNQRIDTPADSTQQYDMNTVSTDDKVYETIKSENESHVYEGIEQTETERRVFGQQAATDSNQSQASFYINTQVA